MQRWVCLFGSIQAAPAKRGGEQAQRSTDTQTNKSETQIPNLMKSISIADVPVRKQRQMSH